MNPQPETAPGRSSGIQQIVLTPKQTSLNAEVVSAVRRLPDASLTSADGSTIVFAGRSGTGKTLAAEVLASELRMQLHRLDLSQLVSKYTGETEKNLDLVLRKAAAAGAILLLDEADALFGRRTDVKDSHDRYANAEVQHLLRKLEEYRGARILSVTSREQIDPAVLQNAHIIVQFPEDES